MPVCVSGSLIWIIAVMILDKREVKNKIENSHIYNVSANVLVNAFFVLFLPLSFEEWT